MSFGNLLAGNIVYRSLNIAVNILITLLLTRLMSVQGYGILSLLVANISVFSLISGLGSESGITFHYASAGLQRPKIFTIIYVIIFFQLLLLGITELLHHAITDHYWLVNGSSIKFFFWGMLYLLSLTLYDKYIAFFNGSHRYTLCNKIILLCNFLILIVFGVLYFFYKAHGSLFYLQVFILGTSFQAAFLIISFHQSTGQNLRFILTKRKDWKLFFSYSLIVFVTNIIQFLAYRVDYWLVNSFRGTESLGLYSLAVKLSQLFWVMPILFASIIFPRFADKQISYNESDFLKLVRITIALLLVLALVAAVLAGKMIPLLFGQSFSGSTKAFLYLLPGFLFFGVNILLAAYFAGVNKLKINFIGSTICFSLVVLLDLWLIPLNGIYGAALASSIAYTITSLYTIWQFTRLRKKSVKDILLFRKDDWILAKNFFKKMTP